MVTSPREFPLFDELLDKFQRKRPAGSSVTGFGLSGIWHTEKGHLCPFGIRIQRVGSARLSTPYRGRMGRFVLLIMND